MNLISRLICWVKVGGGSKGGKTLPRTSGSQTKTATAVASASSNNEMKRNQIFCQSESTQKSCTVAAKVGGKTDQATSWRWRPTPTCISVKVYSSSATTLRQRTTPSMKPTPHIATTT